MNKKEKTLEKAKKDAENDYQGGGAYHAFLKMFYKNKIEEDKKNGQKNSEDVQNIKYVKKMQARE